MKEIISKLLPNLKRAAITTLFSLVFSIFIANHFFRLSNRSLPTMLLIIMGFGIILWIPTYLWIFPQVKRWLAHFSDSALIGLFVVSLLVSGLLLQFAGNPTPVPPATHHLDIAYAESGSIKTTTPLVQLIQIKLDKTGIIPLSKIRSNQPVDNASNPQEVTSVLLPIDYRFTDTNADEMIELLFMVTPPGDEIMIKFDQEITYFNLHNDIPDQAIFNAPIKPRFTPLQIVFYTADVLFIGGVLFLAFSVCLMLFKVDLKKEDPSIPDNQRTLGEVFISLTLAIYMAAGIALLFSVLVPATLGSNLLQNVAFSTDFSSNNLKMHEKVFYVIFFIFGFVFSVLAGLFWKRPIRHKLAVTIAVLAWLPIVNTAAFFVMQPNSQQILWCAVCILSVLFISLFAYAPKLALSWAGGIGYSLLWLAIAFQRFFYSEKLILSFGGYSIKVVLSIIITIILFHAIRRFVRNNKTETILLSLMAIILIIVIIIPASPTYIAADIIGDHHAPYHLYTPALYTRFGHGLIPGFDYFSQYAVGAPYLFAPLLGDSPQSAVYNYILSSILILLVFFISTYIILNRLLGSPGWSLAIVIISLFLQFWDVKMHLRAPSLLVFRYPLFPFILALIVFLVKTGFRQRTIFILSLLLGFSIFWTTETGISFLVASCATIFIFLNFSRRSVYLMGILCLETLAVFFGLSAIAFGSRVFSWNFIYEGVLSPMVIFGGGFGAMPVGWRDNLSYFANIINPMLAVASLSAVIIMDRSHGKESIPASERGLILFCSMTSILFMAKYINRSYLQNWHATALPFIIIAAYWCKRLAFYLSNHAPRFHITRNQRPVFTLNYGQLFTVMAFIIGFGYLFYTPELEFPARTEEGIKSYVTYDSLINHHIFQIFPERRDQEVNYWNYPRVSERDVEIIQKYSNPETPVMIIGYDIGKEWEYYLAAKRAPAPASVPTKVMFSPWQFEIIKEKVSDVIFIPYKDNLNEHQIIENPMIDTYLKDNFFSQSALVGEGDTVFAYKK